MNLDQGKHVNGIFINRIWSLFVSWPREVVDEALTNCKATVNMRPSLGSTHAASQCLIRGIAQSGSAPALGAGCRGFKSLYPDQLQPVIQGYMRS